MLELDPCKRVTARETLNHKFFDSVMDRAGQMHS